MLFLIIRADGVNMLRTQLQDMQLRNSGQKYLENLEQLIFLVPWIWLKQIVHWKYVCLPCQAAVQNLGVNPIDGGSPLNLIQLLFNKASWTVLLLAIRFRIVSCNLGAMSIILFPWSHLSVQNMVFEPSPTSETKTAEKKARALPGT
jgi:hypothetical protein